MMAQWLAWPPDLFQASLLLCVLGIVALAGSIVIGCGASTATEVPPFGPSSEGNDRQARKMQPSESVVHANKLSALPSAHLHRDPVLERLVDRRSSSPDTPGQGAQQLVGPISEAGIQAAGAGAARVWFSIFDSEIEECRARGSMHRPAMDWVADGLTASEARPLGGLLMLHDVRQERERP